MSAAPANRIEQDESGAQPKDFIAGVDRFGEVWSQEGVVLYWTGGMGAHLATCSGWASSNGVPTEGGVSTTDLGEFPNSFCNEEHRLLCVEQRSKPAAPETKHVFVTSEGFTGDLLRRVHASDGLVAGDVLCQSAAKKAGRAGDWTAWLSGKDAAGTRVRAADRLQGDAHYMLFDDVTLVFARHSDLTGAPLHAIDQDENGAHASSFATVWTGTEDGSIPAADTCDGWRSTEGSGVVGSLQSPKTWTYDASERSSCVQRNNLYCFEQ